MDSRRKGKVGEREFAALLRENGFDARRGQQFAGGAESPDVVSGALSWLHVEVKRVEHLNLTDACVQAEGDCARGAPGGHRKPWIVAHRRNHAPWLITMRAETFFRLLRGDFPTADGTNRANGTDGTDGTKGTDGTRGEWDQEDECARREAREAALADERFSMSETQQQTKTRKEQGKL